MTEDRKMLGKANKQRKMQQISRSGKLRWLVSGSLTAAAIAMAGTAQAQPIPNMIVENQPHLGAPTLPVAHQPQNALPQMRVENQPQVNLSDFSPRDIRISSPLASDLGNIAISAPVTLPDANQPQISTGLIIDNQPQAANSIKGISVLATANYDTVQVDFFPGVGTDIISINAPEAIINWVPFDMASGGGPINFLPAGNNLQINSDFDFTLLNRILPADTSRAIRFDGTVSSDIFGVAGGNIWFYSPGGIIAGKSSIFDVGSLILTSNDIVLSGKSLFGPNGEIQFRGALDGKSSCRH